MNDLIPPSQDVMDQITQSVAERVEAESKREIVPRIELGYIVYAMLDMHPHEVENLKSGLTDAIMDIATMSYLLGRNAGKVIQLSEDAKMVQSG